MPTRSPDLGGTICSYCGFRWMMRSDSESEPQKLGRTALDRCPKCKKPNDGQGSIGLVSGDDKWENAIDKAVEDVHAASVDDRVKKDVHVAVSPEAVDEVLAPYELPRMLDELLGTTGEELRGKRVKFLEELKKTNDENMRMRLVLRLMTSAPADLACFVNLRTPEEFELPWNLWDLVRTAALYALSTDPPAQGVAER